MKQLKFRPLRLVKKTGKVVVASYPQWNNLYNKIVYHQANVIIEDTYKHLDESLLVYNHKMDQLFFHKYPPHTVKDVPFKLRCVDCNNIPCFSHVTTKSLANRQDVEEILKFDPLTVGDVKKWIEWIVYDKLVRK